MPSFFWDIFSPGIANKVAEYIENLADYRLKNAHRQTNKLGRDRVKTAASGRADPTLMFGRKRFANYISRMICDEFDKSEGQELRALALQLLDAYPKLDAKRKSGVTNKESWLKRYDSLVIRQIAYAIYDKAHRDFAIYDETATAFDPSHIEYYGAF